MKKKSNKSAKKLNINSNKPKSVEIIMVDDTSDSHKIKNDMKKWLSKLTYLKIR